jgi:guanylate kinase
LRNRSTESPEKIAMRIAKAGSEMKYAPKFDVQLLNEKLDLALQEAEKIVGQFVAQ